jgi:hypothetical protein
MNQAPAQGMDKPATTEDGVTNTLPFVSVKTGVIYLFIFFACF